LRELNLLYQQCGGTGHNIEQRPEVGGLPFDHKKVRPPVSVEIGRFHEWSRAAEWIGTSGRNEKRACAVAEPNM
jgi:hypothetical protein